MNSKATPSLVDRPVDSWYSFCRWMSHTFFYRPMGGVKAMHAERVPKSGPVILAPTHLSFLDPPAVACATRRHLRFMARDTLFSGWFGRLIRSVGAFPVRRGTGDTEALRKALALLADGQTVLIFPEGSRGDGLSLGPINRGVALLARRSKAAVVPTAIVGTHVMWPKGAKRPKRFGVTIAFGEPFFEADVQSEPGKDGFSEELARRLLALSEEAGLPLKASSLDQA